jgi:hypothetical protein
MRPRALGHPVSMRQTSVDTPAHRGESDPHERHLDPERYVLTRKRWIALIAGAIVFVAVIFLAVFFAGRGGNSVHPNGQLHSMAVTAHAARLT